MKLPIVAGPTIQPNPRRLLLLCAVVLVLLAFVRPGLALDIPESKTAGTPQSDTIATAGSGLEATLTTVASSGAQALASCPSIQCSITCDSGLGYTRRFNNTLECFSYSDAGGCRSTGLYVCSEKPAGAGC
jgi:hypothetical protein